MKKYATKTSQTYLMLKCIQERRTLKPGLSGGQLKLPYCQVPTDRRTADDGKCLINILQSQQEGMYNIAAVASYV